MQKIYYNENGYVCERHPNNIPITDENRYVEVDDETYRKTLCTDVFKLWAVINGELINIDLPDEYWTDDLKKLKAEIRIDILKTNLSDTDYIVTKYMEGLISEEEYATIKTQRQSWRDEINQLEEELSE